MIIRPVLVCLSLMLVGCNNGNENNSRKTFSSVDRIKDPYWDAVYVDQVRARDELRRRQSHIIDGINFEISPSALGESYAVQRQNGNREAFVSIVGSLPLKWIVDCENRRLKHEEENAWEDVKPNTKGANVLVHICKLPASYVSW